MAYNWPPKEQVHLARRKGDKMTACGKYITTEEVTTDPKAVTCYDCKKAAKE